MIITRRMDAVASSDVRHTRCVDAIYPGPSATVYLTTYGRWAGDNTTASIINTPCR